MATMQGRALPPLPGERVELSGEPTPVDFFLPTGIMIFMKVNPQATLREIKETLYKEARNYPLFSLLKNEGFYNFLGELFVKTLHCVYVRVCFVHHTIKLYMALETVC